MPLVLVLIRGVYISLMIYTVHSAGRVTHMVSRRTLFFSPPPPLRPPVLLRDPSEPPRMSILRADQHILAFLTDRILQP